MSVHNSILVYSRVDWLGTGMIDTTTHLILLKLIKMRKNLIFKNDRIFFLNIYNFFYHSTHSDDVNKFQ